MKERKLYFLLYLFIAASFVLFNTGCSDDEKDPITPDTVNESEELVKYLEGTNLDFLNGKFPAMIPATTLRQDLLNTPSQITVLDIRSAGDFDTLGHIEGAVNVTVANLLTYYQSNNLSAKTKVVIACYTGQTAGYATALLRMAGCSNVYDLKFGMSSWNDRFATSWKNTVANGNQLGYVNTTNYPKPTTTVDYPTLNTGLTAGDKICEQRVKDLLTEGFTAKISYSDLKTGLLADPTKYFIINYWPTDHYNINHIDGSIQYTPYSSSTSTRSDLTSDKFLKTLPNGTDKTIVIYCYTGQTSAHVAAYLKSIGYNAKSLLFGANGLFYDNMPASKFNPTVGADINDYPYVTGS